jgi:hypothetical protein
MNEYDPPFIRKVAHPLIAVNKKFIRQYSAFSHPQWIFDFEFHSKFSAAIVAFL